MPAAYTKMLVSIRLVILSQPIGIGVRSLESLRCTNDGPFTQHALKAIPRCFPSIFFLQAPADRAAYQGGLGNAVGMGDLLQALIFGSADVNLLANQRYHLLLHIHHTPLHNMLQPLLLPWLHTGIGGALPRTQLSA